jgi:predicted DNA-binding transcriptional regulator AlpA
LRIVHNTLGDFIMPELSENSLLRLPQVLALIPVSRSTWWAGCKSGRFPKPIKLGPRTSVWRYGDIAALLEQISRKGAEAK